MFKFIHTYIPIHKSRFHLILYKIPNRNDSPTGVDVEVLKSLHGDDSSYGYIVQRFRLFVCIFSDKYSVFMSVHKRDEGRGRHLRPPRSRNVFQKGKRAFYSCTRSIHTWYTTEMLHILEKPLPPPPPLIAKNGWYDWNIFFKRNCDERSAKCECFER